MSTVELYRDEIADLARSYERVQLREFEAKRAHALAQSRAEAVELYLVQAAYEDGTLNGRNAEARARAETAFRLKARETEPFLVQALQAAADQELDAKRAEIDRKTLEVEISLLRALLYSQADGWALR